MISKYDKIRQLYIERLSGMFTEEDELGFQELLELDANARKIVHALEEESNNSHIKDFLKETDEDVALEELKLKLKRNQRLSNLTPWLIAATITSVVVLTVLWHPKQNIIPGNKNQVTHDKSVTVSLKLSNGTSVELLNDTSSDTIAIGKFRILTKKSTLEGTEGEVSSAMNVLTVPAKKDYKIVLSDGTRVWLNSQSTLTFPFKFKGTTREVTVEGEAYFEVAKNAAHPFIVRTKQISIRVVGTCFNVNTYNPNLIITSLVKGKVNLSSQKGKTISLISGYEAQFNPDKGFVLQEFNQENVLSWIDGIYYLQNTPLGSLKEVISRWFDVDVVFDNPELKDYQITGILEKGQLSDFLKDLKTSAKIEYSYSGNILHIK
ncbi:FecR family protein [Pedobacter arcticus]|uniref:FecR family protein n=1 Tax=Pedobacter arcticus TaxID=752140 RepID=UPI0003010CD7|nr:FecR domain-containing protein [Pedobacter arcticus]